MSGVDPALMIGRQSSGGNDRVDMVMGQQVGTPCMQDGEESDLCAQPPGIGGHFEQGLGTGFKQQIEQWPGSRKRERVQFVGQGKHDVEIVCVEHVLLLGFEPSPAGLRLALGATS